VETPIGQLLDLPEQVHRGELEDPERGRGRTRPGCPRIRTDGPADARPERARGEAGQPIPRDEPNRR
jgi:hypothetical protein